MSVARPQGELSELTEANDITVVKSQMSLDELVNEEDILNTDRIINQGRLEEEEEELAVTQETYTIDLWSILKKGSINLILPFINGMMLGFGEILAHEIGFKYNWRGAKVSPPRRIESKQRESKFL